MATRPRSRRRSKFTTVNPGSVRKHSIYFPAHILAEIGAEAVRLDRSLSWMVQHAWKRARAEIAEELLQVLPPRAMRVTGPSPPIKGADRSLSGSAR